MVGELKLEEVKQDIEDARDLGLNGFALNFGEWLLPIELQSRAVLTMTRPVRGLVPNDCAIHVRPRRLHWRFQPLFLL